MLVAKELQGKEETGGNEGGWPRVEDNSWQQTKNPHPTILSTSALKKRNLTGF